MDPADVLLGTDGLPDIIAPRSPNAGRGNVGAASELVVAADLIRRGYEVFRAISPSARCDLVIVTGAACTRIEVRTTSERKDGTLVPVVRIQDECDLYAFVCGGRIEYVEPEAARLDTRHYRGPKGEWRRP